MSAIDIFDFSFQIQGKDVHTEDGPRPDGQNLANGANVSFTTGTPTTGLPIPTTAGVIGTKTPTSTSVELTTTETKLASSHTSTPLTSGVTMSTAAQTDNAPSTESTTLDDTSPCQPNMPNTTAAADYPTDCSRFYIAVGQNAIQTIYPSGSTTEAVLVNCLSTCDGLWTVIQRRFDGSVDFYRNWADYKKGFGNASGEYWLGNDAIHQLTSRSSYKLKIVLKDWGDITAYAVYDPFQISDESDGYRLTIGDYQGNAGDSLWQHNGHMFSTPDRDNDVSSLPSCAVHYSGAWWYYNCLDSNLNGLYFHESGVLTKGRILLRIP